MAMVGLIGVVAGRDGGVVHSIMDRRMFVLQGTALAVFLEGHAQPRLL